MKVFKYFYTSFVLSYNQCSQLKAMLIWLIFTMFKLFVNFRLFYTIVDFFNRRDVKLKTILGREEMPRNERWSVIEMLWSEITTNVIFSLFLGSSKELITISRSMFQIHLIILMIGLFLLVCATCSSSCRTKQQLWLDDGFSDFVSSGKTYWSTKIGERWKKTRLEGWHLKFEASKKSECTYLLTRLRFLK